MKKSTELQENSEKQFIELQNMINKQKGHSIKIIEILKKTHTEILEPKNPINDIKSALDSLRGRW